MKTFYNLRAFFSSHKKSAHLAQCLAMLAIVAWPSSRLFAQAPVISYGSPHTYVSGAAISPLSPGNSGGTVAAPAYSISPTTLASGVAAVGVAVDAPGNIYFADVTKGMVYKMPAGGGPTVTIASGFQDIAGVTVDAAGNVYFCSVTEGNVYKIAGDGSVTTIGSGFSNPKGLAADAAGNVYVGDITPGVVTELPATGGSAITIASGFGAVEGIGLDGQGNVYVLDEFAHHVVEVPANGGGQVIIASGFIEAESLAVNFAGDVYVYDGDVGDLWMIPAGGSKSIISSNYAKFLAVDGAGNLYLSIPDGTIGELSPIGGYYINKALPAGLSFSAFTGTISGTPTAVSNAANYTVTAFNAAGSGTATVNITVGVPPSIGYSTPHSYNTGTAITPLAPLSSRVAAWGYSSSAGSMGLGTIAPQDVAADAAGNVYVADLITNHIIKIPAGNGTPVVLAAFTSPFGLAADAAGNVYVASASAGAILEIPAGGGTVNPIGSGFSAPSAVAVDGSGNVYVADAGNGALKEVPAGNGTPVTIQSGFANIQGVTVDGSGNIYVADAGTSGNGAVYKILPGGGSRSATGTGFSSPSGVAVDAAGNLYVSDINKSVITVIEPDGTQFTIGSGFNQPGGLALDGSGNLYIADSANGAVKEIKPTGGYFLSPFLPAGLTFNNSTGIISGTPIAASPAANYTVTAYNSTGSGTATVNITTPLSPSPVISYSTPQTYMLANAITPLSPVNTGGAVAALGFNPAATPVSTGISDALCMAKDKLGNLYIGEGSGQVSVLPAGGSAASVFATGFGPVYSIAVDASNNVYVGDSAHLWKIPAGGGTPVTLGSLSSPVGIAFDAAGNLYVADNAGSDEGVYKMAPDGTGQTRIDNGIRQPTFLAFDANGNLFIADQYFRALYELPVYGPQKQVAFGFSAPVSLTTDPSGNVYLSDQTAIYCYSAAAGLINFAPVPAYGLMADVNFNLYYSSLYDGMIYKISPHGGYFTSPELPPGLTINPNSGIINGTPLAASAATNYSVTGFNGQVSSTATVNITVGTPPPPVINYSTPQIYTVAKAITPLSPVSTGGTVAGPAFNTATTNLSTGFFDANCMARDRAGNIYIGESTGRVSVLHPGSNGASVFATGFSTNSIRSIAADAPGNVYAADGASVWKIPAGGGAAVKLGSFVNPVGLASDPAGNIYVADNDPGNGGAFKITPGGTIQQIDLQHASEIAADINGNIFLGRRFQEIQGQDTPFDVVLNDITAFTMDPIGNIYLADLSSGTTTLYLLPANGSGKVAVGPRFGGSNVTGLMAGADLSLYAVVNGGILKLNATGGYFISPELPPGLIIDPTTGAITGIPAAASPAANYTVTAFNNGVSGTATVNITVNLPPPPAISYSTPQTYTTGTAITPLQPLNTGSAVAGLGFNNLATTLNTGFSDATCLAMDKSGNIYIGESSGKVSVLPPGNGPATVFASGFGPVAGIAIDTSGNVYVADGSSSIRKIPAGGGTPVSLGSFSRPAGVALDAFGNIYVADAGGHGVYKMAADGTGQTKIGDGSAFNPGSVALDANGNVFVVDEDLGALFEIPAGGAEKTINGYNSAVSVTTDASGNIYVGSGSGNGLFFTTPSQSVSGMIGSSLRGIVTAVMVDPNFNLYAVDGGAISKINAVSGYFVSPELPAGLTIDPNSGAISGTPSAVSPAANYTVTAFSNSVSGNAAVNITVNPALPVISYATPQTYTEGAAITPLLPSSTGGGVAAFGYSTGSPTVINTGLGDAFSIAMDKSGDLYIGQFSGNVAVLPAGASTATAFATGFGVVFSIALDASNNVYLADGVHVWKIPAGGGTPATLGSFQSPAAVAFDAAGYLYVADNSSGAGGVYRMAADGTGKVRIDNNLQGPAALAFDANGNLFIGDQHSTALYEIPAGGTQTLVASGFSFPIALTTDASGNVFMSDIQATYCYSAGAGVVKIDQVATHGLTTDANFNLYYTANSNIYKISPTGGYFTSSELPKGLTINPTSGAVSGTPTAASPAANYTVTAFSGPVSGTATVNITVNIPPPPAISYSTPHTYTQGAAITPLLPASTGSAVAAFGYGTGSPALINTGLSSSLSIAMDKSGNLYIGQHTGSVAMLPAGGSVATVLATGFGSVFGITVDASNNVYFADGSHVWTMPAGGGTPVTIGSGFQSPVGLAFDAAGYLYVADNSSGAGGVYKMAADGTGKIRIDNNIQAPAVVAFDANGNLFIGDQRGGAIDEIPAGGTQTQVASGFFSPLSLTTDASGNVFMSDTKATYCYSAGAGVVKIDQVATHGLMTDANFNLYYTFNNNVYKISPTGGYFISPELPQGLTINTNSGAISGTPSAVSPATDFTVTAFTAFGSGPATVNITVSAPTPVISYSTPQVFEQNTAIAPLSPTASNVGAPAYFNTATTAGTFAQPFATAVGQSGNVYVADKSANSLYELLAGGGQVTIGTGLNTPAGVAVDKSGNVYTVSQGDNAVVEIQAHTGTQTNVGSGYQRPTAVAVDSAGNVFVADVQGAAGVVYKIAPGQSKQLFKTSFISPNGLAVDAAGNVYVSDFGGGATPSGVYEISADGRTETPINRSFSTATGIAIDASGNLFITDAGNTNIVEYPAGGGSAITLTAGLTFPFGLSADGAGNLYVADPGAHKVVKLAPEGGYFINRALPAGLTLDAATGIISGTPTAGSPATDYAVTAYNITGSGAATVNIKVTSADATLAGLSLSSGTLGPAFSSGVTGYTAAVPNSANSITVTAIPTDAGATVATTVNGTPASGSAPLNMGSNTISVKVTAADGITTKTYTVTVTRVQSINAYLSSISPSVGHLSPTFAQATTSYTLSVSNATATMTVTPVSTDPGASIKVNGSTVTSGTQSNPITLAPGAQTTINIAVTAPNGHIITYAITVTRAPDFIATLSNIQVSAGTPKPVFAPAILNYNVRVTNLSTSIAITPTATDPNATIVVNGSPVASGSPVTINNLVVGDNNVNIVVTAQDGSTKKTYTVTVNRPPSINCFLASINPGIQPFSPVFAPATTSYTLEVSNAHATMTLAPVTAEPNATMTINNIPAISGARSGPIALALGPNTITVVVTAQDGKSKKTYTITVTRDAPPVADIANTVYQPVSVEKPITTPTLADDGIVVHQGISPNGDGQNDFLQIDNIGQYPENKLSIMNRNGQLVYETKGYDNSSKVFDGHNNKNGQMQLPGTYFYQLDYTVNGATKHKTGFLVLKY